MSSRPECRASCGTQWRDRGTPVASCHSVRLSNFAFRVSLLEGCPRFDFFAWVLGFSPLLCELCASALSSASSYTLTLLYRFFFHFPAAARAISFFSSVTPSVATPNGHSPANHPIFFRIISPEYFAM